MKTLHQKLDEVLAILKGTIVAPPAPVLPKPTTDPRYARFAGMTPQEVQSPFGPLMGQGLPSWWDWETAYANGVVRPGPVVPSTGGGPVQAGGSTIPWNPGSGDGQYLRCSGPVVNLQIVPPAGYSGKRQYLISPIPPTAQSAMTVTIDGVAEQFGQYGQGWTGVITGPTAVQVQLFDAHQPVDGAFSIQLIGPQ